MVRRYSYCCSDSLVEDERAQRENDFFSPTSFLFSYTPYYVAPEILSNNKYDKVRDTLLSVLFGIVFFVSRHVISGRWVWSCIYFSAVILHSSLFTVVRSVQAWKRRSKLVNISFPKLNGAMFPKKQNRSSRKCSPSIRLHVWPSTGFSVVHGFAVRFPKHRSTLVRCSMWIISNKCEYVLETRRNRHPFITSFFDSRLRVRRVDSMFAGSWTFSFFLDSRCCESCSTSIWGRWRCQYQSSFAGSVSRRSACRQTTAPNGSGAHVSCFVPNQRTRVNLRLTSICSFCAITLLYSSLLCRWNCISVAFFFFFCLRILYCFKQRCSFSI